MVVGRSRSAFGLYEPSSQHVMILEDDCEICEFAFKSGKFYGALNIMMDHTLNISMMRTGPGANGMIVHSNDVHSSIVPYFTDSLITSPTRKGEITRFSPDTRLKNWGAGARRVSKVSMIKHHAGASLVWKDYTAAAAKRDRTVPGCGELLRYDFDWQHCWNYPVSPCHDLEPARYSVDDGYNRFVYDETVPSHLISMLVSHRQSVDFETEMSKKVNAFEAKSIKDGVHILVSYLPHPFGSSVNVQRDSLAIAIGTTGVNCFDTCTRISTITTVYECDSEFPRNYLNDCTFINDVFDFVPRLNCTAPIHFTGPFIQHSPVAGLRIMINPFTQGHATGNEHLSGLNNSKSYCQYVDVDYRNICACKRR